MIINGLDKDWSQAIARYLLDSMLHKIQWLFNLACNLEFHSFLWIMCRGYFAPDASQTRLWLKHDWSSQFVQNVDYITEMLDAL